MNRQELINQIKEKRTFLCIGLDTDIKKIPSYLLNAEDPVLSLTNKSLMLLKIYVLPTNTTLLFMKVWRKVGGIHFKKL